MSLDFSVLVPEPGVVDPSDLADALDLLAGLAGATGVAVPSVASAATTPVFAADAALVTVTGTTAISAFDTHDAGERRLVRFASAGVVVNHGGAIACPGGANITSEAGTLILVVGDGTSTRVWQVWHPSALVSVGPALPPGFLFGLGLANNALDAANDIDVAAGKARDAADGANLVLAAGLTKRLDAAWSAGTNQGGLDTGSKANSTTYHLWLIGDGSSTDALFSASATAPTMPGGYTLKRRIGAVITDGSGGIRAFVQAGDEFLLAAPPLDINSSSIGTSRSLHALTVPAGLRVKAIVRGICTSLVVMNLCSPDEADAAPSSSAAPLANFGQNISQELRAFTNTARQLAARSSVASTTFRAVTLGWVDRRGRDG